MNYEQQRNESKRKEIHELGLLILVSVCLFFWWWGSGLSNVEKTPEMLRYVYDASAKLSSQTNNPFLTKGSLNDNGTVQNGYLSELCGIDWYADFYDVKNRSRRMELLNQCDITPVQQSQAIENAKNNIVVLHDHIRTQYKYYEKKGQGNVFDGKKAEIRFKEKVKELDYFTEHLKLNNGRSELLDDILMIIAEAEADDKQIALAFLATSEGDTAFPYYQLFAERAKGVQSKNEQSKLALRASQLNQTAEYVRKNIRINKEWAEKAVKTQRIISPLGYILFLAMAWWSYILLILSRRLTKPVTLLGVALVIWSIIGLIIMPQFAYLNKNVLHAMSVVGLILLFTLNQKILSHATSVRNTVASRIGYPLFVLFLGIGFGILMDLSVRAHLENRFLILNQFSAYYWAFVALSVAPTIGFIFSKFFSRGFAWLMLAIFWTKDKTQRYIGWGAVIFLIAMVFAPIIVLSTNNAIELLKLWLVFGLAIFLTVSRFSLGTRTLSGTNLSALIVILGVPVTGMLIMTEMGTLLVISYAVIIIFASYLNYASGLTGQGATWGAFLKNNLVSIIWATVLIIGLTALVITFAPMFHERTAERVDSWLNPFVSVNEQLAIIHWLRHSAPFFGYSLGEIPWCGFVDSRCYVPKQMQSDYTPTSVMLVFGIKPALILLGFYAVWLLHFIKGHMKANTGIITSHHNLAQVFLVWSGMIWVMITLCQMMVTLAGNLGALPLTGITLPFISYGMSSLVLSSFFIGLLINRPFIIAARKAGAI